MTSHFSLFFNRSFHIFQNSVKFRDSQLTNTCYLPALVFHTSAGVDDLFGVSFWSINRWLNIVLVVCPRVKMCHVLHKCWTLCIRLTYSVASWKPCLGAGDTAQWLIVSAVLAEDRNLVSSGHVRCHIAVSNFWRPRESLVPMVSTWITPICTNSTTAPTDT